VQRADGSMVMLPGKFDHYAIAPGDVFVMRTGGGGGWGDPYERDPEQVRREVECRLLAVEQARELYGVVLEGWPPCVETDATRVLRAQAPRREGWIDRGVPQSTPGPHTFWELAEPPAPWLVIPALPWQS